MVKYKPLVKTMKEVLNYLNNLLQENQIIVVATSGGPDSMFLLNLLVDIKKNRNLKIVVAHVNHKLRKESEEEAFFVEEFCSLNHLIYEYMEIKEYNHNNLENEARQKRYDFFKRLVHKYKANYIMTAHHGDDLIETIMMRLVRGSSIKGYSGFKKEIDMGNYKLIRPLITITKEDILNYLKEHNLKYFIDKSNFSREYTRNRYRLDILPFLKKENKKVHLKFLKFSQELNQVNTFIDNTVKDKMISIKDDKGINIDKLRQLDTFLIKKVIEYELSLIYVNDLFLVSDKNRDLIIKLIHSNKANKMISLPNNYWAIKEYNYLKIVHTIKSESYKFELNDIVHVPTGTIKKVGNSDSTSNNVIRLNSKEIKLPLIVRNRLNGDRMSIKNLNGTKKIKDVLIDEKIDKTKRDIIPIVTDSLGTILWIPGIKKSIYDKVKKDNLKFNGNKEEMYDIILAYEEDINEY